MGSVIVVTAVSVFSLLDDKAAPTAGDGQDTLAVSLAGRSTGQLASDPSTAARLAVTAWNVAPVAEARKALLASYRGPYQGRLGGEARGRDPVLSPDGRVLATRDEFVVRLWDVKTRQPLPDGLVGHTGTLNDVAFSPDGRLIATSGDDHTVRLWTVATRLQSGPPMRFPSSVTVGFPDDNTLVTVGNGIIEYWDVKTRASLGSILFVLPGETDGPVISPDGSTLAIGTNLWDLRSRKRLRSAPTTIDDSGSPYFSAAARFLLGYDSDRHLNVWDLKRQQLIASPLTTDHLVQLTPDGRTAVEGASEEIRLVDPENGKVSARFAAHGAEPAVVSRDGSLLVTTGSGIALWRLSAAPEPESDQSLTAAVCMIGGGAMTDDDWRRFAPGADPARGADACA